VLAESFREVDVIVTSYETMMRSPVLRHITFDRIVLDEAHRIRNRVTATRRAADVLKARIKWCLTGTPIVSNKYNFISLCDWLGLECTRDSISDIAREYMLRRTFEDMAARCERLRLPPCRVNVHRVDLSEEEKAQYNSIIRGGRMAITGLMSGLFDENRREAVQSILALIAKLQQFVVSPSLVQGALDDMSVAIFSDAKHTDSPSDVCPICLDQCKTPCKTQCGHHFCSSCLTAACVVDERCPMCRTEIVPFSVTRMQEETGNAPTTSRLGVGTGPKMTKLEEIIDTQTTTKAIVFTHYHAEMDLIEAMLLRKGIRYWKMNGGTSADDRQLAISEFNHHTGKCVMISNIVVGGTGLNLQTADTVIFPSLDWTPAQEMQAISRAHRLGCTNVVNVHRIVANGTIDEHVISLQQQKLDCASDLLKDGRLLGKLGVTGSLENMSRIFNLVE